MVQNSKNRRQEYDVVVAGHLCLDIIPKIPKTSVQTIGELLRPGKLVNVESAVVSTGGPVSNTGIGLKKLGMKVAFMARVSDDDFGRLIIDRMQKQGNASTIKIVPNESSSYTIAIAVPSLDRAFLHNPGTNHAFNSDDLNFDVIRNSKIFHLGYPPLMRCLYEDEGEELLNIFKRVKETGVTTSLDMALPDPDSPSANVSWRKIVEKVLPFVDIFMPSIEEIFFMLAYEKYIDLRLKNQQQDLIDLIDTSLFTELATHCLNLGAKLIVFKTAHRGIYFRSGSLSRILDLGRIIPAEPEEWANRELWCPAFHVSNIASATGSGDSAVAGFLSAYNRGHSVEKCLKYANCLGYENLHELDALSGIKSWAETSQLIDSSKLELNDAMVAGEGWYWDEEEQLWIGPNQAAQ